MPKYILQMMRSVGGQTKGIPVKAVAKEGFTEETGSGQAWQRGKDREDGGTGAAMQGAEAPQGVLKAMVCD